MRFNFVIFGEINFDLLLLIYIPYILIDEKIYLGAQILNVILHVLQ